MLKKLLIKSLSAGGELLNVVSCFAGQVSVFRAHSPSELKPYQRALAGLHGAEKFSVALDGHDYLPQHHTLIGFAEQKLSGAMTVRSFFEEAGATEETVDSLLLSYGLDQSVEKTVSELSVDEERRARLLEATFHPDKALIINEPFEPVSSQWRERFAELLVGFARNKNGLVIITSLSYRPECWIDNDSIQRIQVGENTQRTIGYGSAGSQANQFMNQLRDAVRNDQSNAPSAVGGLSAGSASVIGTSGTTPQESPAYASWFSRLSRENTFAWKAVITSSFIIASGVGAYLYRNQTSAPAPRVIDAKKDSETPKDTRINPEIKNEPVVKPSERTTITKIVPEGPLPMPQSSEAHAPPPSPMVLDAYPEAIRLSIISTTNGDVGAFKDSHESSSGPEKDKAVKTGGNIFNLLETASTKQAATGNEGEPEPISQPQAYQDPPEPEQQTEEQQRREAIRQKFLEAIRAAAERRQQAQQEVE